MNKNHTEKGDDNGYKINDQKYEIYDERHDVQTVPKTISSNKAQYNYLQTH